jgi:hypothetical protein
MIGMVQTKPAVAPNTRTRYIPAAKRSPDRCTTAVDIGIPNGPTFDFATIPLLSIAEHPFGNA